MTVEESISRAIKDYSINKAYIMMYFYDKVVMGKVENGNVYYATEENEKPRLQEYDFEDGLCYEIHIFNREMELRWRRISESTEDKIHFIKICDPEINEQLGQMFLEEKMFIVGSRGKRVVKKGEGCTSINQYGREIILPFEIDTDKENLDLRLVVHHLFNQNGNISGYRLADIEGGIR